MMQVQQRLFQQLKQQVPENGNLAEMVASLLYISTDSAYRRMRCETPLTADELVALCRHFKLSLDEMLQEGRAEKTIFETYRVDHAEARFEDYLGGILLQLQAIDALPEKEIIYASKDIPLFHFFHSPLLLAFKHFFWMKTIIQHPDYQQRIFEPGPPEPFLLKTAAAILELYNRIPSTEVWNIESINSTLLQLEFYRETNVFRSADDLLQLCDALEEAVDHVETQAEYGAKGERNQALQIRKTNYRFFYNTVILADTTIFVQSPGFQRVFINYGVLNYLTTTDKRFVQSVYADLQNLLRKSTLISQGSSRQRSIFFRTLRESIRAQKQKIQQGAHGS